VSNLYQNLASVYDAMYQTFINYKEEYTLYSGFIKKYHKQSLLEIGCGSGSLAQYFLAHGFDYLGADLSKDMIAIAAQKNPTGTFMQADMRQFTLPNQVDSMVVTGRTISYLITNNDVQNTLKSIHQNLNHNGIFCFDFIDANKFIPDITPQKAVEHKAVHNQTTYVRKSIWSPHLQHGMDVNWQSVYYKIAGNDLIEIGKDQEFARAFTKNEIEIFIALNGFQILEMMPRETYFFPTYVVVAEKG